MLGKWVGDCSIWLLALKDIAAHPCYVIPIISNTTPMGTERVPKLRPRPILCWGSNIHLNSTLLCSCKNSPALPIHLNMNLTYIVYGRLIILIVVRLTFSDIIKF